MTRPKIAIAPEAGDELVRAVELGGGEVAAPADADALVWTDPLDHEALRHLLSGAPVKWVQLPFAGIERFYEAGVVDPGRTWTCAKGIYGHATAEHALALTLAAARLLHRHIRSRTWIGDRGAAARARRLAASTVVLVGTGGIGAAFRDMVVPIGARLVAVNRSGRPLEGAERTVPAEEVYGVVGEGDFVVLAAPATASTRHLVGTRFLDAMHRDAWLVNVARGSLVDTGALVAALRAGEIGGAALDVTDPEPLPDDHPLWSLDNVVITGHTANTWGMAVPELAGLVEDNVRRYRTGEPLRGLVDPTLGY